MISFSSVLLVSGVLFAMGVVGVLIRRSALMILMSIEVMLNAANLAFVGASRANGSLDGQMFAFFVMAVAAAEAAVGLAIVIALFRQRRTTDVDQVSFLKW
jgi:NADH-quinone oxidoreductase subunit K